MFLEVAKKIITINTFYFAGLFVYLKMSFNEIYVQKYLMKHFFKWYIQILCPIWIILYHWILHILFQTDFSNVCINNFCTPLLEVKTDYT